ncbi:MAG TPA: potassium-transporting ATPase subunit F [Dinghuibacter sp.]|nr:potassium-transporting ATPase subunit F [Dinghuibacter sp.]HTJ13576.1 potassium-transporting ATPase subunit F [Dinghuibacter sp.]
MKKSDTMILALFILSIAVFLYLLYVLIKPEKF